MTKGAYRVAGLGAALCMAVAGCSTAGPHASDAARLAGVVSSQPGTASPAPARFDEQVGAPSSARGSDRGPALATASAPAGSHPPSAPPTHAARPAPCARNRATQLVKVSLRRQHLWMCARDRLVRDTPITSGMAGRFTSTPTGNYEIQGRSRHVALTLNSGEQYHVKYWIPFDAPMYGFHDSPWQHFPYGSPRYRTHGSHGCVHMPLEAIAFLYRWAKNGAKVRIRA